MRKGLLTLGVAAMAAAAAGGVRAAEPAGPPAITECNACLPGPTLLPGMRVTRQVGPALFTLALDAALARVEATVRLQDASIGGLVMTAQNPTAQFDVHLGDRSLRGSLGAFFCAPPTVSHVLADFIVETQGAAEAPTPFRGDLVTWESPISSVIARSRVPLLPDLEARVDLVDPHADGQVNTLTAQVGFFYGTQVIDLYALSTTVSPVTTRASAVGPVRIDADGVLSFRAATAQQRGQVRLKASLRSSETGSADYDGVLADWPWIEGRADNCRGQ